MSALTRIVVSHQKLGADVARLLRPTTGAIRPSILRLAVFVRAIAMGAYKGSVELCTSAVKATATLTFTGAPSNNQTFTLCGTTFTAKTSGATGNQFNIGGSVTATADNVVAAVNDSATTKVTGAVVASNVAGVVTFTAKAPGAIGNGLTLVDDDLSNCTAVDFASGSDGTLTDLTVG